MERSAVDVVVPYAGSADGLAAVVARLADLKPGVGRRPRAPAEGKRPALVRPAGRLLPALLGHPSVGTDDRRTAEGQRRARVVTQRRQPRRQRARLPGVVGVAQGDRLDPLVDRLQPRRSRDRGPACPLAAHERAARGVVGMQAQRLGRAIVDHDHLRGLLAQHAVQRLGQVGREAVDGDDGGCAHDPRRY